MMVAATIGVTMLGLSMSAMVQLYKQYSAAQAYRNIHENARHSLALMSKDLRSSIGLSSFASNDVTFSVLDSSGGTNAVRYWLQSGNLIRSFTPGSGSAATEQLTDNVTSISFERWERPGQPAYDNSSAFEVRAFLTISNTSFFQIESDLLQTRILMRNKTY